MTAQDISADSYRSSSHRVYMVEGDRFAMRTVDVSDGRFSDPARHEGNILVAVEDVYSRGTWNQFYLLRQVDSAKRFIHAYTDIASKKLKPCSLSNRREEVLIDEEALIEVDGFRLTRRGSTPGAVTLQVPAGRQPNSASAKILSVCLYAHDYWRALFCEAYYSLVTADPERRAARVVPGETPARAGASAAEGA